MNKICVQMLYTEDWVSLALRSAKSIVDYCDLHGYSRDVRVVNTPYNWIEKLSSIRNTFMRRSANVVWSLDCDAIITNPNFNIETFLDNDHDFYVTKDFNGINCGSFIVKDTEYSYDLINWVLKQSGKTGNHCEQDAINSYMKAYPNNRIKILPQSTINSYKYELYPEIPPQTEEQGQWVEGKSHVLHLPGVGMSLRNQIFDEIANKL